MEALGFDAKYFLFQVTNFLVLFFLLKKLLHKPLLNMMDQRRLEIEQGLKNAEAAEAALQQSEIKQQELLEAARREARAIVQETKEEAVKLGEELKGQAEIKAQEVIGEALTQIKAQEERSRTELKQELSALVLSATEKVLGTNTLSAEKQTLIKQQTEEIKDI